jgi:hypothetical protein
VVAKPVVTVFPDGEVKAVSVRVADPASPVPEPPVPEPVVVELDPFIVALDPQAPRARRERHRR